MMGSKTGTCFEFNSRYLYFSDELPEGKEFEVIGDIKTLIEAEKAAAKTTEVETDEAKHEKIESTNGNGTNGSVQGKIVLVKNKLVLGSLNIVI